MIRVLLRPRMLALHALGVVAVLIAYVLGQWQIDAWLQHRIDRTAELADLPPVPITDVLGPDDAFPEDGVGRPVQVTGEWLPADTILLRDRLHEDDLGFWQVVPVAVCDQDCTDASAIPVVVGWSPSEDTVPAAPQGRVELTGWLQPAEPESGVDDDLTDDVLAGLRTPDLLERMDRDLYTGYVILDEPAAARGDSIAVTPDSLPEAPFTTSIRNLFYGIEWWFFGLFAAYMWVRWSRDEIERSRRPVVREVPAEPEPSPAPLPSKP